MARTHRQHAGYAVTVGPARANGASPHRLQRVEGAPFCPVRCERCGLPSNGGWAPGPGGAFIAAVLP